MNKKGQVLVVFILILPLILMFLGLIIDIGNSLVIRKKSENILKNVVIYTYRNTESEELKEIDAESDELVDDLSNTEDLEITTDIPKPIDLKLLEKNIKKNLGTYEDLKINLDNDILEINVKLQYKSIFGSLFNIGLNKIDINLKYDTKVKKIVRE